ncbi:MAG: hypothetical protein IJI66_13885 [Erysipelotrichaceae bacterium]|nr:hypothetical protein [Erysipelotrichaceae bacterium]
MAHTLMSNVSGFMNGSVDKLIGRFGENDYADVLDHQDDVYLDTCLYKKYINNYRMNLMPGLVRALSRIVLPNIKSPENFGGYGYDKEGNFYMDYYDGTVDEYYKHPKSFDKHRHIVMKLDTDKKLSAVVVDEHGSKDPYVIATHSRQTGAHSPSAVLACLFGSIHASKDPLKKNDDLIVMAHIDDVISEYEGVGNDLPFGRAVLAAVNDMYTYIVETDHKNLRSIDGDNYTNPIITKLQIPANIEFDSFTGDSYYLSGKAIGNTASVVRKIAKTVKELISSENFALDEKRVLSANEELMVPKLDDMVPDPDVITKARLLKGSTLSPRPFRNIKWVGETGTGKSTAAQILAQMLNLPYTFLTFNPDTILSDLYVNILPSNKKTNVDMSKAAAILETAVFNPGDAWKQLTGEDKEVSTKDVLSKLISDSLENESEFMYVESPLVQAFRFGWLVELQETNLASKPGVLGGLNAALDDLQTINLPDGEVVKRHKDCVVVMTENEGYEGTRRSNQAVDSRMTLKGKFVLPEKEELALRISQNSGLKDMKVIEKMIDVMYAIRKVRNENGETNGACSVREVQSWAQATDILGDPYEAAMNTIVPSAYRDEELFPAIKEALETQFSPKS